MVEYEAYIFWIGLFVCTLNLILGVFIGFFIGFNKGFKFLLNKMEELENEQAKTS